MGSEGKLDNVKVSIEQLLPVLQPDDQLDAAGSHSPAVPVLRRQSDLGHPGLAIDPQADRRLQLKIEIDADVRILHFFGHDPVTDPVQPAAIGREVSAAKEQVEERFGLTAQGDIFDDLVPIHALALAASEQIFFALSDLYARDLETARKRIRRFDEVLKATSSWIDNKTPADAEHRQVASRLATDRAAFSKFLALVENLGQPRAVSDAQQNAWGYLDYNLRQFGQAKSGFILNTKFGY